MINMSKSGVNLPVGVKMPDWSAYRDDIRRELEAAFTAAVKPLVDDVANLRAENESLLANLRGKHALTGATYAHLVADRDQLRDRLRTMSCVNGNGPDEPLSMQVGPIELIKKDGGWLYKSEGMAGDHDVWCEAGNVLGPFGGSGVEDLLDELFSAKNETNCDAAVAAIEYALNDDEGLLFLRYWNQGDFDVLRREWKDVPDAVFVGADPLSTK